MLSKQFFTIILVGLSLALAPRLGVAQSKRKLKAQAEAQAQAEAEAQRQVLNVHPGRNTQYVFRDGAVVQRLGTQLTPLAQNVRLPGGTKINVRSGIVELVTGKLTSLHEGDYVNADGGIVFATPGSAAAARGDSTVSPNAKFDSYIHIGSAAAPILTDEPTERELLFIRKIELLNRKVSLLTQTHTNLPNTDAVDKELKALDAQLKTAKRTAE